MAENIPIEPGQVMLTREVQTFLSGMHPPLFQIKTILLAFI